MFLNTYKTGRGKPAKRPVKFNNVLYPYIKNDDLISTPGYVKILRDCRDLIALPTDYYDQLYQPLFSDFARFVQVLPTENLANMGSILNNGLNRCHHTLKWHRERSKDQHNHLLTYVLCSASLMFEVGKVINDRHIIVCDAEGRFMANWLPFSGPIGNFGSYYKLRETGGMPKQNHLLINAHLAKPLMPEVGFSWLAEHPQMLAAWINMLNGREPQLEGFKYVAEIIKEWKSFSLENQGFHFPETLVDELDPTATTAGDMFLAWLKKGLLDGSISINQTDSLAHMTADGLFLEAPAVFQKFANEHQKYKQCADWRVVQKQFNELGVTKLSGDDVKYDQYYATNPESARAKGGRHSVFTSAQNTAGTPGSITDRFKAAGGKFASSNPVIKEGVVIQNKEILYGNSPIPPVSELMKPVAVNSAMMVLKSVLSQRIHGAPPPLFPTDSK